MRRVQHLGVSISGAQGFDFDIEIHVGAGAYICGEEPALIKSLEGKPGKPRIRPPFPVAVGYLGKPTVVNNAETLAEATVVALQGGPIFAGHGTRHSAGTKILSVLGDCARPGIYEYPFGVRVEQGAEGLRRASGRRGRADQRSLGCLPDAGRVPAPHRLRGRAYAWRVHDFRQGAGPLRGRAQFRPFLRQ